MTPAIRNKNSEIKLLHLFKDIGFFSFFVFVVVFLLLLLLYASFAALQVVLKQTKTNQNISENYLCLYGYVYVYLMRMQVRRVSV